MNTDVYLIAFYTAVILFQIVAIPALILKKNDLADVLWGPAFPISAGVAIVMATENGFAGLDTRSILIFTFVSIWALRLFIHVGARNLAHVKEDVRYNNWRKQWGKTWLWRSYLQVFVLQALILYTFLIPVLHSVASPSKDLGGLAWLGAGLWIFGFLFESIADEQLRRFKKDPKNKGVLMTSGLWSWSRHPNYFGEVVQWWGVWLLVAELPNSWFTIVSPLGVTYLLLKVSGVDMLEELMKNRPGFEEYAKRTSVFFPRPPKKLKLN